MPELTTTLARIREHGPCRGGWSKLKRSLPESHGDHDPIAYSHIVRSNGLEDALWCCRAEPQHASLWRNFAVDAAECVLPMMTDERSREAVRIARLHAHGVATDAELAAARDAAMDAARDGDAAMASARDAARYAAKYTAWSASMANASASSMAASCDAAWASRAASRDASRDASSAASRDASMAAAWASLAERFTALVDSGEWSPWTEMLQAQGRA